MTSESSNISETCQLIKNNADQSGDCRFSFFNDLMNFIGRMVE